MKFAEEKAPGSLSIRSYSAREVQVAGPADKTGEGSGSEPSARVLCESFIITPEQLLADWPPERLDQLAPEHLEAVAELAPELVILGCGSHIRFPSPAVLAPLSRRGIGCEVMDTGAACRTFNLLAAEGRSVAAAIFMIA